MNGHPGRDTDVISRLSKSTIQDLSFYIGFTRIRSRIKDLGSWTLFWHEWASQKGYGRDIKTVQVYNPRSIILYRFYKDPIKDQASWTLFWHELQFQTGSGRDIKTARIYNRFSISFQGCWKLTQGQHEGVRRKYRICINLYRNIDLFVLIRGSFQDILVIQNQCS